MSSQRVVAGASTLSAAVLLHGCGSDSTTTAAPPAVPTTTTATITPAAGEYNESYLIEVFGNDPAFLWGAATAAAQIEGAWDVGGKQASIWDDFCHSIRADPDGTDDPLQKMCGHFPGGSDNETQQVWTTLAVTDDFYHKYEADLDMLSGFHMNAMRISLSWPRLMPLNTTTGQHEPSQEGINFYKRVLAKMKLNGITPVVTLFHWDLPNDLSFLNTRSLDVVEEFAKYAKMAFDNFHEDVQDWATFNEPTSICSLGYAIGAFAPGHQSTTDHLKCGQNLLLSHARAVQIFRDPANAYSGQIGIVLDYKWTYPNDANNLQDKEMAQWDRDNVVGFWADPIFGPDGDYPQSMKDFFGDDMPVLSEANRSALKGSADFWGANTYGGKITKPAADVYNKPLSEYEAGDDMAERYSFCPCNDGEDRAHVVNETFECAAASGWLWATPDAMFQYLNYISTHYNHTTSPKIYVTEFGCDLEGEGEMQPPEVLHDDFRVKYYQLYMMEVAKAKRTSSDIQGVFAWSLMDNFEWGDGLNFRFGITYVDFLTNSSTYLNRTAKDSATWWSDLIPKMNPTASIVTV